MRTPLRHILTKRLQKIFWIYLTKNFRITSMNDFIMTEPARNCAFIRITLDNCGWVRDFREEYRVSEYRQKLAHKEIGFFAEINGKRVGSIWTTINSSQTATVVRSYMPLMPKEAIIHDIVTGDRFRGIGIGPFMVGRIASILLNRYGMSRIIIDVNVRNRPSLRMMEKAGLKMSEQVLYISVFGRLILQKSVRQHCCASLTHHSKSE